MNGHLEQLPGQDAKSRAIVEQTKADEIKHADTAIAHGGAELPAPVKQVMQLTSKILTKTVYWV